MIVDSHVNLHGEKFTDDLDETIQRAREAGVGPMLSKYGPEYMGYGWNAST